MKTEKLITSGVLMCASAVILAATDSVTTTQPQSQTVNEGDPVTFNVVAESATSGNANFTIPLSYNVNLDMVWCPAGTFMMGSPDNELGRGTDETLHQVTLSNDFWIGKYEITQAQYRCIMGKNPAFDYGVGDNYPVYWVAWNDAINFCSEFIKTYIFLGSIDI